LETFTLLTVWTR